jgi:hypothetical protein
MLMKYRMRDFYRGYSEARDMHKGLWKREFTAKDIGKHTYAVVALFWSVLLSILLLSALAIATFVLMNVATYGYVKWR